MFFKIDISVGIPSAISASRTALLKAGDFLPRRLEIMTSFALENSKKFLLICDFCVVPSPKNLTSAIFLSILITDAGQTHEPFILNNTISFIAIFWHATSFDVGSRFTKSDLGFVLSTVFFGITGFIGRTRNLVPT